MQKEEQLKSAVNHFEQENMSLGRKLCDQYLNLLRLEEEAPRMEPRHEVGKLAGLRAKADFNLKPLVGRRGDPNDSGDEGAISRPRRRSIDALLWPSPQDVRNLFNKEYIQPSGALRQQVSASLCTQDRLRGEIQDL